MRNQEVNDKSEPLAADLPARYAEMERAAPRRARLNAWLMLGGLTTLFLISILYHPAPADPNGNYFTICGFKNATGLPCPGCGLTHSFCALGKGHLAEAAAFNHLGPALFAFLLLLWLRSAAALAGWRGFVDAYDRAADRLRPARLLLLAFLVYGAGRIIYLAASQPETLRHTPVGRLIAWLGG